VASLVDIAQRLKRDDALKTVETGRGVMPSFAFLSEGQRARVVDYLYGISSSSGGKSGREENGEVTFGQIPYTHTGYTRWLTSKGHPAVKPPWGTLNAIDLNTGEFKWQVPLGEFPQLTKQGIPKTGTENYGGPVVTAGGLVFIAASKDEHIRAFDKRTGEELWEAKLPAGGYATPAVYAVAGRQFIVIACGGGKMQTKSGDAYVAFALPEEG
jgi:quinoprotein glucose dehydrogenase